MLSGQMNIYAKVHYEIGMYPISLRFCKCRCWVCSQQITLSGSLMLLWRGNVFQLFSPVCVLSLTDLTLTILVQFHLCYFIKNILVIAHLFAALSFLLLQWKTFVSWSLISRIYIKHMQKKYLFLTSTLKIVAVDWEHSLRTHHMFSTRNVVLRSDSWAEHMLIKGRHFPVSLTVSLAVYSWNANNLCSVQRYN